MQTSRRICKFDFTLAAGGATTLQNLNPDSLAHAHSLLVELSLTTIGTDAGDSLDVKLQEAADGNWTTRLRFPAVAGNAGAPRLYRMPLLNTEITLQASEKQYESTADAGVAEIAAGTQINGPFIGLRRTAAGRQPSWRLAFVTTDANSNATWAGNVTIWAISDVGD